MLDLKLIADNPDLVKKNAAAKNERRADVDRICALNDRRRKLQITLDDCRQAANAKSKEIQTLAVEAKRTGKKPDFEKLRAEAKSLAENAKAIEEQFKPIEKEIEDLLIWVPNIAAPDVPVGEDARANKTVRTWGEPRKFDFAPKAHWDLGKALDILDEERSAKLSGSNWLLLKGAGARLERALINFMTDLHITKHGYTEIWPPFCVNRASMFGTGQIPKLEEDMYRLKDDELWLIPTAEVPVTNLHRDEILSHAQLPVCYTSYTACFRREAGAYGKDTRGMVRIHQFDKVEMVKFAHPDRSWPELETLTANAEEILQLLEIPYRVVLLSTGDMSFASAKTYDLEAWAPGVNRWLEVSSCSNFTDFQARRANIRFRDADGRVKHVHTLNGSGLALPRTVIAVLENFQQPDGSVVIPEPLRPYMGGMERISK
ncbi:MAG: serine--tRNA ligase [Planctomycetes bacterium]|nr:serine--tRNA ligase [Planctomycetota bacterium]